MVCGLWSVYKYSVSHFVPPPPTCKGNLCQHSPPFPLSLEGTMPFMQRLTCTSPAGLISLCFIAMLMRTRSSSGNCMPTLQRHGRDFRKPCLIGAAPGKACPSVCWLSAELKQENICEQSAVVSPLASFGASSCSAGLITSGSSPLQFRGLWEISAVPQHDTNRASWGADVASLDVFHPKGRQAH